MARRELITLLEHISDTGDVGALFHHLGYRRTSRPGVDSALILARHEAFEVHVVATDSPAHTVRVLARRLGTLGTRALAVAYSDTMLAIAAPRAGKATSTKPLVCRLSAPAPTGVQRLAELAPEPSANALEHWLRVVQVLSTEDIGRRFFQRFQESVERVAAVLDAKQPARDRRLVALIILTRVLFLYFVQAKGWLDNDKRFLSHQLDAALRDGVDFHTQYFEPLCFGVLNRAPVDRTSTGPWTNIPYLNGGLFEPHLIERKFAPVNISPGMWRDLFDGLFERFRFCPTEGEEADVIAPDMLGHVFERLMDPADRRGSGSFYTPANLVRRVIDAAFEAHLIGHGIASSSINALIIDGSVVERDRPALARGLQALTLLDPAVGSGAFLVGALQRLTELRSLLEPLQPVASIRRDVLRSSLFGVDRNPMAVRLAELRLWLTLIADPQVTDPADVTPLPNLDGLVRQGDTLMDPVAMTGTAPRSPQLARAATTLRARRAAVFEARGHGRTPALRALRAAEFRYADHVLDAALTATERRIRDIRNAADSPDLFGRRGMPTREQRRDLEYHEDRRDELTSARRRLHDHDEVPFFSFGIHAGDIMARGGFAVVAGNPPWVRAERLPRAYRQQLGKHFRYWHTAGGHGYAHQPDLAVAFLEQALRVAAPGGVVALLLPSKLATAGYGASIRGYLAEMTTILAVERIADHDGAHFQATAYPLALVVRNTPPVLEHRVAPKLGGSGAILQHALNSEGPWLLLPDRRRDALKEFHAAGLALAESATLSLGVKTGVDRVFVGELERRDGDRALLRMAQDHVWVESAVIRPALRGRDVRQFGCRQERVLLWGHDDFGHVRASLPPLATEYFARHLSALRARADYQTGPTWQVFRVRAALGPFRLVWSDLARRPRACVLELCDAVDTIPLNTCYVATSRDETVLLAASCVLNSTWGALHVHTTADEARGGYRRVNARVVGSLPTPPQARAAALAALAREAHAGKPISTHDLDEAVADSLALSPEARHTVRRFATDLGRPTARRP